MAISTGPKRTFPPPASKPTGRSARSFLSTYSCRCSQLPGSATAICRKLKIALAWLLARKPWIVPIPGTTKLARLDENLGAVRIELTADDLHWIDRAAAQITVQGARYPERLEQLTGR